MHYIEIETICRKKREKSQQQKEITITLVSHAYSSLLDVANYCKEIVYFFLFISTMKMKVYIMDNTDRFAGAVVAAAAVVAIQFLIRKEENM